MTRTLWCAALAAGLAMAGSASAAQETSAEPGPFNGRAGGPAAALDALLATADANGDGALTREELAASRAAMFDQMDANADGVLDEDERPSADGAGRAGRRFAGAMPTEREAFVNAEPMAFRFGDTDENGVLSADEIAALKERASRFGGRRAGAAGADAE